MKGLDLNKKYYLILIGLVAFFYLGYQFSFSDTFELKEQIREKEKKLEWLKEKEKELPQLEAKMKEFESSYSKADSMGVRDHLTAFISEFAEKNACLVTEIPTNSSFKGDKLKVQTNTFTVKGEFKGLLKLLHQLEFEKKYLAKVMSVRFYSMKDMQSKRKNLYLTIITQSFEQERS